jgi:hypothetical protein
LEYAYTKAPPSMKSFVGSKLSCLLIVNIDYIRSHQSTSSQSLLAPPLASFSHHSLPTQNSCGFTRYWRLRHLSLVVCSG